MFSTRDSIARRTRSSTKKSSYVEEYIVSSDGSNDFSDNDDTIKTRKSSRAIQRKKKLVPDDKHVATVESNKTAIVQPRTPRKQKSHIPEKDLIQDSPVTPPKQHKSAIRENVLSPSSLLNRLQLDSSPEKSGSNKCLFKEDAPFQSARKALHSSIPTCMPGREKEHEDLYNFICGHLMDDTSATLYISGLPGTGKTASLSVILQKPEIASKTHQVYVNCTSIKSSGSIFSKILKELNVKNNVGKTEKECISSIENYICKSNKMLVLVLDELDQLESKKQSVLYTIFEWPAMKDSKILLIGIANALDLTDRVLPRLQMNCRLKPKLMHFAPYTKQQIVQIITDRLNEANVLDVFAPVAIQMLAGKVAAVSGDIRRALDIGRRVIELVDQQQQANNNNSEIAVGENGIDVENKPPLQPDSASNKKNIKKSVDLKQVMYVLNNVYGTSQTLDDDDSDESFPLQQKIILCSLLLILKRSKNKDVTVGRLHEVYRKVCKRRNITDIDQTEFVGLCSLIETRGIFKVTGRKEARLNKVNLQWNEQEVELALKDKKLISTILDDDNFLEKI